MLPVAVSLVGVALAAMTAAACQTRNGEVTPGSGTEAVKGSPKDISITDAQHHVLVAITAIEPCRASIDGVDLIVGTSPLVAQLGATNWAGDLSTNGTTLKREGKTVARVFAASDRELALFDPEGVAIVRAALSPLTGKVVISDRQGSVVRMVTKLGPDHLSIVSVGGKSDVALDVTGTDDALLAAIAAAPEAIPEVRALASCNRLFPNIETRGN